MAYLASNKHYIEAKLLMFILKQKIFGMFVWLYNLAKPSKKIIRKKFLRK